MAKYKGCLCSFMQDSCHHRVFGSTLLNRLWRRNRRNGTQFQALVGDVGVTYCCLICGASIKLYRCTGAARGDFCAVVAALKGNLLVARLYICVLSVYVTTQRNNLGIMLRGCRLLLSHGGRRLRLYLYSTTANPALVRSHNTCDG
jgi:hypothetical protein